MLRRVILVTAVLAGVLALTGGSSSSPPAEAQSCSTAYPDFCIPPPPPDVDCTSAVIGGRKNFTALAPDPHGLDAGGTAGVACEDASQPRFPTTTTSTTVAPPASTTTTLAPSPTTTTTVRSVPVQGLLDRTG